MKKSLISLALIGLVACSGPRKKADPPFGISPETPEGAALNAFFDGDVDTAEQQSRAAGDGANARFVRAEIAYADGDAEAAFTEWAALLSEHPDAPLARLAAARLYAARDEIVDFERRITPVLERISAAPSSPLTRVYLGLIHQTVAYREWSRSTVAAPLDADRFGFPARWLASPNVSPWRLRDFDVAFAPEQGPVLAPRYLSPATAQDVEKNYEETVPYWTQGITIYPPASRTGLHYLETFATVEGDEPRDYWLYGNFVGAAKVWIDGTLVLDRRENGYDTGKRLRRIRLTPGTHRVLVKVAYQPGYRDWFDLMFVPEKGPVDASGLTFAYACLEGYDLPGCIEGGASDGARVVLRDDPRFPMELEPVRVEPNAVADATDVALYATMLAAHYDGQHEVFGPAWRELESRRPKFAAGYALYADHLLTLWQMPSDLRDARALRALRQARELDPHSTRLAVALGERLAKQGDDREARRLLAEARDRARTEDGRLRSIEALREWASILDSNDWSAEAEKAWRDVLAAEPSNCRAASEIQRALYSRGDFAKPEEITAEHDRCPTLRQTWIERHEDDFEGRLELARRDAQRAPLRGENYRRLASYLWQLGRDDEAEAVMQQGLARDPSSPSLWAERADRLYGAGDEAGAVALLERFREEHGNSAWLEWKLALLRGELPLHGMMPDGHAEAMKVVEAGQDRSLSADEAYFVIDFAARRYFPDGSHVTLTHTVVRVMTKGAIDRYGEQNTPGDARVVLVRTIKQDGTVRVPEQTAGKSTLSMPGLAEGDFVEVAYVEWGAPREPASHVEGVRFFFRMRDISTLRSEYVVIGDIAEFMRYNDAPAIERFEVDGLPAVRFLARNNPRPRSEPRTVSIEEYLPWVQMYRHGHVVDDLEVFRRDVFESILDSSKTADAFEEAFAQWTSSGEELERGSLEWVKHLFYQVSGTFPDPSIGAQAFNTDVNHAILEKRGNSMLVLKTVFDRLGITNDVYLVRSRHQIPEVYPMRERYKYGDVLLRTVVPETGEIVWLYPGGPDAMFNAVPPWLAGQPALCATCIEPKRDTVATAGIREQAQALSASATLDAAGNLSGTLTFQFDGVSAASLRSGLRSRTDPTSRAKFADVLAAGTFAGATATDHRVEDEFHPDRPLRIVVEFEREGFAREVGTDAYAIETRLFADNLASAYAPLPTRTTPLFVSQPQRASYTLDLDLSAWENVQMATPPGERRFESAFGTYKRSTSMSGGKAVVSAELEMPIQRVPVDRYGEFQKWALAVEQSSAFLVRLRK